MQNRIEPGHVPVSQSPIPRSRSSSFSKDAQLHRVASLLPPPPVNPQPAYIASSAASQIIAIDHELNAVESASGDSNFIDGESALVAPDALSLLNAFLDYLLFNILAAAKSTQLRCIRPAVAEVLKPRLAREVVSAADDELSEYMGNAEEDEFDFQSDQELAPEFELIRAWKLTRLRCMVYIRLGDMEEEEEEEYIEQEGLHESESASRRFSIRTGNIAPAAAIFLTSIIEYIGEQALILAGDTARARLLAKGSSVHEDGRQTAMEGDVRLIVGEMDIEKLAMNGTLGRLWRSWRKCMRSQNLSRTLSRESFRRRGYSSVDRNSRNNSITTIDEPIISEPASPIAERDSQAGCDDQVDPASIALPMSEYDVQEIEVPGLADELVTEVVTMKAMVAQKVRPRSLMVASVPSPPPKVRYHSSPAVSTISEFSNPVRHGRSKSLPSSPNFHLSNKSEDEQVPASHSEERTTQLETMYEHDERETSTEREIGVAISTQQTLRSDSSENKDVDNASPVNAEILLPDVREHREELSNADTVDHVVIESSAVASGQPSLSDRHARDTEVIEGQGTYERPIKASIQRPRRKSSKDTARNDAGSQSTQHSVSGLPMQPVTKDLMRKPGNCSATSTLVEREFNESHGAIRPDGTSELPSRKSSDNETTRKTRLPREAIETSEQISSLQTVSRYVSRSPDSIGGPASISDESDGSHRSRSRNPQTPPTEIHTGSLSRSTSGLPGLERAAVQRVQPRPSLTIVTGQSPRRRSDSSGSGRPLTAGSTTSQVSHKLKGLIVRPHTDSTSLRVRSSSEMSRLSTESKDPSENDKLALDTLIQSDETIHFTLTPKNMREMERFDSPRWKARDADFGARPQHSRDSGSSPINRVAPDMSYSSSMAVQNVLPSSRTKSFDSDRNKSSDMAGAEIPRKVSATLARDARPTAESVRDFANFIKSTGPDVSTASGAVYENVSTYYPRRPSDSTGAPRQLERDGSLTSRTSTKTNGSRLQARAPAGHEDHTSDLIDFLREGPTADIRRLSPATSDSDFRPFESSHLVKSTTSPRVAHSYASTLSSSMGLTGSSDHSNHTRSQADVNSMTSSRSAPLLYDDDARPARKQRRVMDPFGLDFDDDDDLGDLLSTPKSTRAEVSLMDFLQNVPPPSESQSSPQLFTMNESPSRGTWTSRLIRNTSFDRAPATKLSVSSFRSQPENHVSNQSSYAAKVGMERMGGMSYATLAPLPTRRQTETSALANFLRNTGPPEPIRAPSSISKETKNGSFSRLFARRKKLEV